jgi:hypothetical protein
MRRNHSASVVVLEIESAKEARALHLGMAWQVIEKLQK